ncbi:MAG: transglutaminase domain-containing protein [Anaerolineales bacterium]|nr:transglutaminase domain-containing protein [Anaerolineales bacterium]
MPADIKRSARFWDWRSAALTLLLLQIASSRLTLTDWAPFLNITQTLAFFGAALGFALGHSSFEPRFARWFGFAYGMILIPAQLLNAVERVASLRQDLANIFLRVLDSLTLLIQNQPVYDPLFFVAVVAFGFWNIGLYAGYQLTRRQNFLGAALPAGIVILTVQVYDAVSSFRVWFLAAYIFIALALLGRLYFLQNRINWQTKRVFFTSDMEVDLSRTALVFAAIVVFAAWIFPNVLSSVAPAARAWTEFTQPARERLSDAVSALDSPYRAAVNGDFYGSELALGSSAPISNTPVFYVKVDNSRFTPARYYWRGRTYDQYANGQWSNSVSTRKNFNPAVDQLQPGELLTRYEARFTVTLNFPKQELLYAPAEMIWNDRLSRLITMPATDSTFNVTAWLASSKLTAGDTYALRALIANPSVVELRGAEGEYPQWVKDQYLQVPIELEPQLRELAERATQSQDTPYDKAQAITAFLRNEIEYATKITDSPPAGADPVMWVLSDYKKGFCMYSASAEVLMLRSLGIPARMAVGFAEGKFDAQRDRYVVARLNSHAWPEAYFPNIGWIEFEPTGNQSPLERPREPIKLVVEEDATNPRERLGAETGASKPPDSDLNLPENGGGLTFDLAARFLYALFLLCLFALGIFLARRYSIADRLPVYLETRYIQTGRQPPNWLRRWSKWATLVPMQRAFHSIDLSLRWLGAPQPARATPLERANALADLLPSAREDILALKEEHESALFANRAGDIERARRASWNILLETARARLPKSFIRNPR